MRAASLGAFLSLAFLVCPDLAFGQNPTVAEALFQDGQKLFDQGKVHEACAKFAESQRNDPGLGTLLRLALCHEKEGKSATAWAEFEDAAAQSERRRELDRAQFARQHAAGLAKALARVVLEMAHPPRDLVVTVDDITLGPSALGTALPLDPGDHVIRASASGKRAWSMRLSIEPGATSDRVAIPPLEDEPALAPSAQAPDAHGAFPRKTVAYVAAGTGTALIGIATYLQIHALALYDDSRKSTTGAEGRPLYEAASRDQLLAQVMGGAGVVAAGAGVVMLLWPGALAPSTKGASVVPAVGAGTAGVVLSGAW